MRWRRPERCHAIAVASDIVGGRYKLRQPAVDVPVVRKTGKLDKTAFGKGVLKCSLDLHGVCTTKQKAAYFSPTAANGGLPFADLAVLRAAYSADGASVIEKACLGAFAACQCTFAFKRVGGDRDFGWCIGLTHYTGSAIAVWPIRIAAVPHHPNNQYIEFDLSQQRHGRQRKCRRLH